MSNENNENWKIFSTITNAIGVIAIPVVIFVLGTLINSSIKQKEANTKLVEMAVSIIKEAPGDTEGNTAIRKWAIDVIDNYSEVKLPKDVKIKLLDSSLVQTSSTNVTPTSYFYDAQLSNKNKTIISSFATFASARNSNNVRCVSSSNSGKAFSQINNNVFGYISPYQLDKVESAYVSDSPTLTRFIEIHKRNNKYYLVGRGLMDDCCEGYFQILFGVSTQMNETIEMPFGLMTRRKGKVFIVPVEEIFHFSVQEIKTVFNKHK